MKKFSVTDAAIISKPILLAVALLASPASQAQQSKPQNLMTPGACPQVKNPVARNTCLAARSEFAKGNYLLALSVIRKSLAESRNEPIIRVEIARVLMRMDSTGPAERELRQARQDGAPDQNVLPMLFDTMIANHKEITLLNEFPDPAPTAKGPLAAAILQGRAMALRAQGEIGPAAAAMDRSLSLNRTANALLVRASLADQQKDAALASKLVDEAFKLAPQTVSTMAAKLDQLERANDLKGMIALSYQMEKLYPINSDPREARIRAFLKQNENAKAKAEIDAFQALRPKSPVMNYYRAVLLSRAHDKKGASQLILGLPKEFVRSRPELAVPMAQMMLDDGHSENSAAILGAALAVAPDMLDVRLKLAGLRLQQNSPQSALLVLGPVKDSRDPEVQKLISQAQRRIDKDRAF